MVNSMVRIVGSNLRRPEGFLFIYNRIRGKQLFLGILGWVGVSEIACGNLAITSPGGNFY